MVKLRPSANQRLLKSQPDAAPDARLCQRAACSSGFNPAAVAVSSLLKRDKSAESCFSSALEPLYKTLLLPALGATKEGLGPPKIQHD